LFQHIQADSFVKEIKALTYSKEDFTHFGFDSKIRSLCPFLKDGIIRMSSRTQYAKISYAARNPVILPNKHPLIDLFIHRIHVQNFHAGKEMTIAMVRDKVWIIDIRKAVNRVFRNCQFCKNVRAKPRQPRMGNLPIPRLSFEERPFTHVGIDAFGPYNVKYGRGTIKRWGLLITCLTYRAVHLECLNDMYVCMHVYAFISN
jgi:Integrase zinc binding domain